MASAPIKLHIKSRGTVTTTKTHATRGAAQLTEAAGRPIKRLPKDITLTASSSTEELYAKIAHTTGYSVHRLRITKPSDGAHVPKAQAVTLEAAELDDGSIINVKDLGQQISWRTVFVIEYLGPIVIHLLTFYTLRPYVYPPNSTFTWSLPTRGQPPPSPSGLQRLTLVLILIHFLKREAETLFLHHFSSATMPIFNIFKNSAHYWGLSGLLLAYAAYAPYARISGPNLAARPTNALLTYAGVAVFAFGEWANLNAHRCLARLRSADEPTKRGIPKGFGFDWVTCPNYTFEMTAWVGVWMVSRCWVVPGFLAVSGAQMYFWALKKEKRLRKEFPAEYRAKRYVILPGIL